MALILPETNSPVTPPAGSVYFFTRTPMPQWVHTLSDAGREALYNPTTFGPNQFWYRPSPGATLGTGFGQVWDGAGSTPTSITHPVPSSASFANQFTRTQIVSGTTPGTTAGIFSGVGTFNNLWLGNAANQGGFLVQARWCRRNAPNGSRGGFLLLSGFGPNFEPSEGANSVGFSYDSTDTTPNYFLRTRRGVVAGGLSSSLDLGNDAPRNTPNVYETWIYALPNATEIHLLFLSYASENLNNPLIVYDGAVSTNIPFNNVMMAIELNASPGPNPGGVGQVQQTLDVHWIRGWRGPLYV